MHTYAFQGGPYPLHDGRSSVVTATRPLTGFLPSTSGEGLSTDLCCQEDVSPNIGDRQIRPAKRKSVKLYPWVATLLDPPTMFIVCKDSLNKHWGIAFSPDGWELLQRYSNDIALRCSGRSPHTFSSDLLVPDLPILSSPILLFCWLLSMNWCQAHSSRHLVVQTMWRINTRLEIMPTSRMTLTAIFQSHPEWGCNATGDHFWLVSVMLSRIIRESRLRLFLLHWLIIKNFLWGCRCGLRGWQQSSRHRRWGEVWVTHSCNLNLLELTGSDLL